MFRLNKTYITLAAIILLVTLVFTGNLSCEAQKTDKVTTMLTMRDKVKLATDIYLPSGEKPWPVVLVRLPYNKDVMTEFAQEGVKRGYAVVVQDCRGRFASEGDNLPFLTEARDGYDTIEWIVKQPWCNGKIGTTGGSALGITQLAIAGTGTSKITCQHISVASSSLYDQMAYRGGVFRKSLVEDWVKQCQFDPESLHLWKSHPDLDSFWKPIEPDLSKANYPAVHIGGWYDLFAQGTIDSFTAYSSARPNARNKQHMIIGPWTHFIMIDKSGELTFHGADKPPTLLHDQWHWADHQLMGKDNGIDKEPAVIYYVMGDGSDLQAPGNTWRKTDTWPPKSTPTHFYLQPDKTLSRATAKTGKLEYTHDPNDPIPTHGGPQLTIPAGPMDQRQIENRPDVLVFTSDVLTEPLEITGRVRAYIWASSDADDMDYYVRLCDVYPDGRSMNICEGVLRGQLRESYSLPKPMKPGQVYKLGIDLWSTSIILNKDHRIRVHVASSCNPGYEVCGTKPTGNVIYTGTKYPSHVLLPVVSELR